MGVLRRSWLVGMTQTVRPTLKPTGMLPSTPSQSLEFGCILGPGTTPPRELLVTKGRCNLAEMGLKAIFQNPVRHVGTPIGEERIPVGEFAMTSVYAELTS